MIFKSPRNLLEGLTKPQMEATSQTHELTCPKCKKQLDASDLDDTMNVCPYCRHHFRLNPRQRLQIICDADSFIEIDADLRSDNFLNFPSYDAKLQSASLTSGENEAVVCGTCSIGGNQSAIFVMNPFFMMGSMGSVVGEKITRLFEMAANKQLPVVGFTVSGGARMQEGIVSLMQMAKTSGAVKRHSDAGGLYICVLTDPTTGGVTASFAMAADITLAEPFALVAFAGPRVIEQTMRKKLPPNFQSAEFVLEKGFIDDIVERKRQKRYITTLLKLHSKGNADQ